MLTPSHWRVIKRAYNQEHRIYHNWSHITEGVPEVLELMSSLPLEDQERALVAWMMHDFVYVPGRQDNEELSAEHAQAMFSDYAVASAVRTTKDHKPCSFMESVVCDVDLMRLASPFYCRYRELLVVEYVGWGYGRKQIEVGRREWAEGFLKRDKIFQIRTDLEEAARKNLETEVA